MRRVLCSGWLLLASACHEDLALISDVRDAGGTSIDIEPRPPDAGKPLACQNCGDGQICTIFGCESLANVSAIAAGDRHGCRANAGVLTCWGANGAQQLATGDSMSIRQPERVLSGRSPVWISVAAGSRHTCGLRPRELYCWGDNSAGQLGVSPNTMQPVSTGMGMSPQPRTRRVGDFDVAQVRCGGENCCALRDNGVLYCWGANAEGSAGIGRLTTMPVYTPQPVMVAPGTTFSTFSVGAGHTCAIRKDDRALLCWGRNSSGQLGLGSSTSPQEKPVQVGVLRDWTRVAAGAEHTCGIRGGGLLYCWGDNKQGQLGVAREGPDATPVVADVPTPVDTSRDWARVAAGAHHTCAIKMPSAELRCWGKGSSGQLGSGVDDIVDTPQPVMPPNQWKEVALGEEHSCGLDTAGKLYCWGDNSQGQLGVGDTVRREEPTATLQPSQP